MKTNTYAAVLLAGGKGTQLYPLTPKYTKSLLPIGNRKMIYYQIELLENAGIPRTYILINNQSQSVEKQLNANYKGKMELIFVSTPDDSQTYTAINKFLNEKDIQENLVVLSADTITNISLKDLIKFHQEKKSSFTFALKEQEQKPKGKQKEKEKKKEKDDKQEEDLKLFLIDSTSKVAYAETLSQAGYMGISIHNAVLRDVSEARFHKVHDAHIYIVDQQVLKIVREFTDEGISSWGSEFIPFLINNQSNTNLLKYTVPEGVTPTIPIRPFGKIYTTQFLKRVISIKDYEQINMKSLIRGEKQIPLFDPTNQYTDKLQESKDEMAMISITAEIKQGGKVRRSCILGGVKLGKGVQIVNSVVLKNTLIEDNCKLYNCIVGSRCHIRKGCTLRDCQIAPDCQVKEGSTITEDIILEQE